MIELTQAENVVLTMYRTLVSYGFTEFEAMDTTVMVIVDSSMDMPKDEVALREFFGWMVETDNRAQIESFVAMYEAAVRNS